MPKRIDVGSVERRKGSNYPAPHDEPCRTRERQRLGDVAGLTQFGVNLLRVPPGGWSSQRHAHSAEDEFVFVVSGEVVLVTNDGEEILRAGDGAGFKANDGNAHHLQNRTEQDAVLLEVGSRRDGDSVVYPDIDLLLSDQNEFTRRDGSKY